MQNSRGNRRGNNFTIRWSDAERAEIVRLHETMPAPAAMGPWLVHVTKLTAIWGSFAIPERSPVVGIYRMPGKTSAERAVTPPGFARAFFEANP